MFIAEKIIDAVAPHYCLSCSVAGDLLCSRCRAGLRPAISRCYRCHKLSEKGRTCSSCRSSSKLYAVRAVTDYENIAKDLVWRMKFGRTKNATAVIGAMLPSLLDDYPSDTILAHVPTAPARIRQRGYDQSRLITRTLARKTGLNCYNLLDRQSVSQQHGASRAKRLDQAKGIFSVRDLARVQGAHIVLVDDVLTTGATLESAARALKSAGAKRVEAVVFCQG